MTKNQEICMHKHRKQFLVGGKPSQEIMFVVDVWSWDLGVQPIEAVGVFRGTEMTPNTRFKMNINI